MTIQAIITKLISTLLTPAVPILIGLAVVLFFWGLVKYVNSGFGDTKKIEEARNLMIWGIISITVMVSVWGLVKIVQTTFFGGSVPTSAPAIPLFNGATTQTGGGTIPTTPTTPPNNGPTSGYGGYPPGSSGGTSLPQTPNSSQSTDIPTFEECEANPYADYRCPVFYPAPGNGPTTGSGGVPTGGGSGGL